MIKQYYHHQFMMNKRLFAMGILAILLWNACDTPPKKKDQEKDNIITQADSNAVAAIPHYDMSSAKVFTLPKALNEISGIRFSEKGVLAAQNDEQGKVFFLNRFTAKIDSAFIFGNGNDYEDIVWVKDTLFLLQSNGNIHQLYQRKLINSYTFKEKQGEFETLYYDSLLHQLVILCKRCDGGDVNAYAFSLNSKTFSANPLYRVHVKDWQQQVGSKRIQPSAAAIHPFSGKLYILCSVGKCVLMATTQGKVEAAFRLNENMFEQPEGIAFDEKGNMYISNEAGKMDANIVMIPYL